MHPECRRERGQPACRRRTTGTPAHRAAGRAGVGSRQVGWIGLGGWFGCVRRRVRLYITHLRESHVAWRRLGRTFRGVEDLGAPYICATPDKCRARSCSCRRASWPVVPQYLSVVHGDLSRGSGQFVPKTHSAIEHLTRSRRNCRTPESFSCRFLSWPVRERPPACLYAISGRDVVRSGKIRTAGPVPTRVSRSVGVKACRSLCSICSRRTMCPGNLATEHPEGRRVPTGHLASAARPPRRAARTSRLMPWANCFGDTNTASPGN